ncbi:hypothetical protein [Gordonia neofelifaecis]|uniref:Uncharacterized protein n=1 Tax=Gordonia neofelifaecis NRRL B-59395 TaxID=644548 RepID=F1YPN2_9ACTN|nr:hypothetical protein [Gordonia neofelifaecis]EGD53311.1 hypothetical protein SCNU_19447 [Gordonia neofelifaecis NRRL B-59395]
MSIRRAAVAALVMAVVTVSASLTPSIADAAPPPHPKLKASITLQVPGVVWGIGGAGVAQPRVFYGDGQIYPYPVGYGYRWHWRNLTTGRQGSFNDYPHRRKTIRTGAGQILVSGEYYPQANIYLSTPAAGTFYVSP